jgi:hypothetical protein
MPSDIYVGNIVNKIRPFALELKAKNSAGQVNKEIFQQLLIKFFRGQIDENLVREKLGL